MSIEPCEHEPVERDPVERDPVERLAEEFLERYRRGEQPALSEFVQAHPDLAGRIHSLFPMLLMLEQASPPPTASRSSPLPARLGDYRILREVGRGGMGVVYEAEQESLGRHVALKVLQGIAGLDAERLERFRLEARAAARLHHTNIVPVFEVSECDGAHYYAMQFISGQPLDKVLQEVIRLRQQGASGDPDSLGFRLAHTLWGSHSALVYHPTGKTPQVRPPQVNGAGLPRIEPNAPTSKLDASAMGPSELMQPGDLAGDRDAAYYRGVARIGLQVAEALAHAHAQQIVHRDIKPANLLLDAEGRVWITDFGLAKEEGHDLTRPGDVVGTLRYMAPERFSGVSDPRGDIFSLGLTLYEFLTLRPAFPDSDRAQLIHRLTKEAPVAPRQIDKRVPRDLETIVLKACARDPAQRYQDAEELADDLRLFLEDRPIKARRISWREQAWRWMRRNPGWAATLGLVFGLLLVVAIGGALMSSNLQRALADAKAAEQDKTEKLRQSYVDRARAERISGRVGQRFKTLEAIREAQKIRATPDLAHEAAAALILPDIEIEREWEGFPDGSLYVVFDENFERYARSDKKGNITLCRLGAAGEEVLWRLTVPGKPPLGAINISPDGRYLVCNYSGHSSGAAAGMCVWRLDPKPEVLADMPARQRMGAYGFFSPDSRLFATNCVQGAIVVHDLVQNQEVARLKVSRWEDMVAFDPKSESIAVSDGNVILLFDLKTGATTGALSHPTKVSSLAWQPDGRRLSAGCYDRKIYHWDPETKEQAIPPWTGHTAEGIIVQYNRAGDRLLSNDWGGLPRLWDVNGRHMLSMHGLEYCTFSADGRLVGWSRAGTKLRLYRLAAARELHVLQSSRGGAPLLDPVLLDGDLLTTWSHAWLCCFDVKSGAERAAAHLPPAHGVQTVRFDPKDGLWTGGGRGLLNWPVQPDAARAGTWNIGPPVPFAEPGIAPLYTSGARTSRDRSVLAIPQTKHTLVFRRDHPGKPLKLGPHFDVRWSHVSPDGRWVITCNHWWDGIAPAVTIWDATTGERIRDLPLENTTQAAFSPDGGLLLTNTAEDGGGRLWEVGTWRELRRFKDTTFAFGPEGLVALSGIELNMIRLVEVNTGREIGRLTGPEPTYFQPICFSADGSRLIATCTDGRAVYCWNLRLIRQQLKEMNLDWDWPELPSEPAVTRPSEVRIVPGALGAGTGK